MIPRATKLTTALFSDVTQRW